MQARIDTPDYWIDGFQPNEADLNALYERMIEVASPQDIEATSLELAFLEATHHLLADPAFAALLDPGDGGARSLAGASGPPAKRL